MKLGRITTKIVLVIFVSMSGCISVPTELKEIEANKNMVIPQKVSITLLQLNDFPMQTISNGLLEPAATAELFFKESGIIDQVYFNNGDKVCEGDLLSTLSNATQLLNLRKAEANLKETESELHSLVLGFGSTMGDTSSV